MDMNIPESGVACRIAIIGGGFSGATVALNLLHKLPACAAEITIIEPRTLLGAGLAYSAPDPNHRVNVSAARLLILLEEPGKFDAWLRSSGALDDDPGALLADGRLYPKRQMFGAYLDAQLREKAAEPGVAKLTHVRAKAVAVARHHDGYEITLDSGGSVDADVVVLAVSHPPPAIPRPVRDIANAPGFVADPWVKGALDGIARDHRVLIIGTALSTADAVATLNAAGHTGEIIAVSRRGLVSRQRANVPADFFGDFATEPARTALALVKRVRATIREAEKNFSCWEAVIEGMRAQGTAIWAALPPVEKHRFLRHVRPYWDVHRYQLAPQLGEICAAKAKAGQFCTLAARILSATRDDTGFEVTLRPRHAPEGTTQTEYFDAIINCTGPDHSKILQTNPVLASLAAAGLVAADPYGLGLETDLSAHALAADGTPNDTLFVAGPLARATFGELMGLPQVSTHAALVADEVVKVTAKEASSFSVEKEATRLF
jgi:uncharacterized NAD(P)/FAD-binding protein YdhS